MKLLRAKKRKKNDLGELINLTPTELDNTNYIMNSKKN